MPRSTSPERREERSRHSRDDRERRRSRSPDRHRSTRDEGRSSRDDKGKDRDDRRSRDDDRERRRSRSRSRSPARRRDRSRSPDRKHLHRSSRRRSPSSGSSSDGSDDSRDRRHRRKRSSRDKDGKDSKGRDKDERRKRREEKKAKKERKELKKKGLEKIEWGRWGILTDADIYTKDTEFRSWLVGERMINPETLSKQKEKEIFKEYMEAFNTGTLPSDKYVDTAKYELKMNAIRSGETIIEEGRYDPNKDMADMRASHRRAPVETETFLDRNRLAELRKVQNERTEMERMRLLGMQPRESMGVITQTKKEQDMGVK